MKTKSIRKLIGVLSGSILLMGILGSCGQVNNSKAENSSSDTAVEIDISNNKENDEAITNNNTNATSQDTDSSNTESSVTDLEVRFGDKGEQFMMHLYDNDTTSAIVGYMGTSDWRLPIYERDDNVDYDVLQYYDIPSRYDIPSAPENITSEKAGEVYYSDPNRIVLFYHDAKVKGEYTLIGYFDVTDEFTSAVEENPVLEGWGNKILQIRKP